jgi:hypothetical protein
MPSFTPELKDYDCSVLPTSDPGSNRPWLASDNSIVVGAFVPVDLSSRVAKTGDTMTGQLVVPNIYVSGAASTVQLGATGNSFLSLQTGSISWGWGSGGTLALPSNAIITWSSTTNFNGTPDVKIARDAATRITVYASSGLRIRNNTDTGDGDLTAAGGTFTGNVSVSPNSGNLYLGNGTGQYFSWANQASVSFVSNGTGLVGLHGGALNVNLGTNSLGFGTSTGYNVTDILVIRNSAGSLDIRGDGTVRGRNYANTGHSNCEFAVGAFSSRVYVGSFTYAAVTAMTPAAYIGAEVRITDRGYRKAYCDGSFWRWEATGAKIAEDTEHYLGFIIPAGTTGLVKVPLEVPMALTITEWQILSLDGTTISAVFDIWKDTYANFPPTIADTIVAAAKPTITSAVKANSTTLTGWTLNLNKGDIVMVNVESLTGGAILRLKAVKQ